MIVDDEVAILEKVKAFLESDEVDVVTANNSRQALELMMEKEGKIDLILIDTQMPCSDKTALFSMKPDSKLATGKTDTFLQKPFTKEQLVNFVKEKI
ncbi:MAG: response regulator [Thermoplasmatales archaeon]|nr:MAG: response regulator [Thermoplasmatales archaeon]